MPPAENRPASIMSNSEGAGVSDNTIFMAATVDDTHVLPLLVVLRSACRRLTPGWTLRVFIIGYQIGAGSRQRFDAGVAGLPVEVEWSTLDLESVRNYWPGASAGGGITLYCRLYLAEALPESVNRVLFVDADILVEGDLAELWNLPFDGHAVQAVGAFVGWSDEDVGVALIVNYCQNVVAANGEVLWSKRAYTPWNKVPRAEEAKYSYCRDLLAILNDYADLRSR